MASAKERLALGGGPNSFRGGKKTYSVKTRTGNWVEDQYNPEVEQGSFTSTAYLTIAHTSMLQGIHRKVKLFGTGLPPPADPVTDYNNVFHPDKTADPANWETVSHSFHKAPVSSGKVKGFSSVTHLPKGVGDEEALEAYRKRWTRESDMNRSNHFTTTQGAMSSAAVVPKYQISETRKLPGLPLAVERLITKIHEKSIKPLGLQPFAAYILSRLRPGATTMQAPEFQSEVTSFGVNLSLHDWERLLAFLDPSKSGHVSVTDTLEILRGSLSNMRKKVIDDAYTTLLSRTKSESLPMAAIADLFNPKSDYDVVEEKISVEEGTTRFVAMWLPYAVDSQAAGGGGVITAAKFHLFYHDLSLALPSDQLFERVVALTWNLR